nr:putative ribonuclease H-like domain-containing protein [Tanacetum cinerariifolium]
IKREYSVAKTPQQNRVAERRNRTLIDAARTMLVDFKLPTIFWAEAVNTACYVLNRALVTKPYNKTPYELIHGRPPLIDFMKPFGCPVTILNTKENLGKFEGKADEGYFVGYSMVSKAMRVFNKRTMIIEENLNIRFLENVPNVKRNEPDLIFDINSLTISMNYVPVVTGNQTNGIAGTKEKLVAGQDEKKKELEQEYILIPICTTGPLISQDAKDRAEDAGKKSPEVDAGEASDNGEQDNQVSRNSPFDLEANSDSDYAGASLDRKSTTGGCQFLAKRLISWQCKKQTIVANSTTEAEYVAALNCCGQVLWIQNQLLDYEFNLMNTKIYIDNESTIFIMKNPVFHSKTKHIEIRHHFIRDAYENKLIQVIKIHTEKNVADLLTKAFYVSRRCFVDTSKVTTGNTLLSTTGLTTAGQSITMASAIICLADNQNFNFSKYIFDHMVKILEGGIKFYLFLRFLQVFLDNQIKGMARHKEMYVISSHTKKIYANMRRIEAGFLGKRRKEADVSHDKSEDEEHVPTPSSDPLPSGKIHDADMFGVDNLEGNEVFVDVREKTVEKEVSTTDPVTTAGEVVTAASIKDSAALTTTTTADVDDELTLTKTLIEIKAAKPKVISTVITTPRAKRIVFHKQVQPHKPTVSSLKDKGKAKMIEPEKPLKKKDQISLDEEVVRKLEAEMRAEMKEEERIAREKDEANRDVIKEWDDVQATIDADRRKYFAAKRAKDVEERLKKTQAKGSSKRAGQELEQESAKKHKMSKHEQAKVANDDTTELKRCLEIVLEDDDDVAIEATPISSKSPTIVDYKIYKEGRKSYFKIIRADGDSQSYLTFRTMFKYFNRKDLEVLRSIIKERFKKIKPVDDMENLLFQTLKTMFEPYVEDIIWKYQQGAAKVNNWKLFDSCGLVLLVYKVTAVFNKVNTAKSRVTTIVRVSTGGWIKWLEDQDMREMDNPNITIEEYIRLEEEKTRRGGKVYNRETTTYGKIWCDEDVHDLRSVETEFPAIFYNDALTFEVALSCEPTVSPLNNNQIDFRISFDESDDEDYMVRSARPTVSPQHIDEFNETSFFEYDYEGQNVIYFNDLFPFNVIYPDDLSDKDNDNDKIDITLFEGFIYRTTT